MKKKPKIFLACDTSNIRFVRKIINSKKTNDLEILLKFGLEFFYSKNGRKFISKLKNEKIFLDLKLNDIPNTCLSAMNSLKDLRNISYITAHINGGYEMLKAVKKYSKKINKNVKVLGVSILTSLSKKSLKQIGKNMIKGWHWHKYQTSTLIVVSGNVKVILIQNKKFKSFIISKKNLKAIIIKPKTWYAFQGLEKENNLLNLSDKVHTPSYSKKKGYKLFSI